MHQLRINVMPHKAVMQPKANLLVNYGLVLLLSPSIHYV